jgi:hypothetical protein
VLFVDPKPVLQDGTYRRETYLENVVMKIGGSCPCCGRKLQVLPLRIDVVVPEMVPMRKRKGESLRFALMF